MNFLQLLVSPNGKLGPRIERDLMGDYGLSEYVRAWPAKSTLSRFATLVLALIFTFPATSEAQELFLKARKAFQGGRYRACLKACDEAIEDTSWLETAWRLKIQAQMELGEYPQALATYEAAMRRFGSSIQLRWIGARVHRFNRQPDKAKEVLDEFKRIATNAPARFSDAANKTCVGRFMIASRFDGRQVLELIFDKVKKEDTNFADAYVASAELALAKHEYGMAVGELQRAIKLSPSDPYPHFLLAKALAASDRAKAAAAVQEALKLNPNHIPSLLMLVDRLIDAEEYKEAQKLLEKVMAVNIRHPKAWAYLSVLSHLEADYETQKVWRQAALGWHTSNPEVDHLIGLKLSQKYRFKDGASHQESALKMDPTFLPAKIQLSQDLLRLGDEERGWKLASEVHDKDGYNAVALNLVTLQENLAKFRTLEADGLLVRMDADEAAIYGDRVLRLLSNARTILTEKYDVQLREPTIVEIFPEQKDFAIRTFGLPGGAGFLGVCFGRVITANSPASQGESPSNWEAVLWHEFCHVVTLQKTNNKMPRWLSEGISVYEEIERDETWGQHMSPDYRQMILSDDLTPVSKLSGAFLNPPSGAHLQFAYYESSLVVRYLVEKYGLETLKKILVDLSVGMPINDSLRRYAGSMEQLDADFDVYAKSLAKSFLPKANWDEFDLPPTANLEAVVAWNRDHPNNVAGLRREATEWAKAKNWAKAKQVLEQLRSLYGKHPSQESVSTALATVYGELGDTEAEYRVLKETAAISKDSVQTYLRLMALDVKAKRWKDVLANAERLLAVNPLMAIGHRQMAQAAVALKDRPRAIAAYRSIVALGPIDPAETHFRLAQQLLEVGDLKDAKRQTLKSLEEAPRYREAHQLLLKIVKARLKSSTPTEEESAPEKPATKEDEKKKPTPGKSNTK